MYCSRCNSNKNESEFYFRKSEGRHQHYCKPCFNSYCNERWKSLKTSAVKQLGGIEYSVALTVDCVLTCVLALTFLNLHWNPLTFYHSGTWRLPSVVGTIACNAPSQRMPSS